MALISKQDAKRDLVDLNVAVSEVGLTYAELAGGWSSELSSPVLVVLVVLVVQVTGSVVL